MAKVATFVETFSAQSAKLSGYTNNGISLTGGRLRLATVRDYTGIGTQGATPELYDLTGSSIAFQVFGPSANDGGQLGFSFSFPNGVEVGFTVGWTYVSTYTGNSYIETGVAPGSNPYVRIRENAGTIAWDTSPDGATWTQRRTMTTPTGADSVSFAWFAGGGPSNTPAATSYVEVDNVNTTGTGASASAPSSASGQLVVSGRPAITRAGAFSSEGVDAHAPSRVSMVGPSVAFSGTGTNGSTGTKSTVGSAPLGAAGTLGTAPRAGLRATAPETADGTLTAYGTATVNVEALVDLETVWLNPVRDLTDGQEFATLNGLKVTTEVAGEFRRYTTGRVRSILRPGRGRTFDLDLKSLDRAAVSWLEQHAGQLVCVRDDRGRKAYVTFLSVPVTEHAYNGEADVSLSLVEVTHSEAV